VISDGRRLYLVGYSSITALKPYKHRVGLANHRRASRPKKR
jgi:hypothetical protein